MNFLTICEKCSNNKICLYRQELYKLYGVLDITVNDCIFKNINSLEYTQHEQNIPNQINKEKQREEYKKMMKEKEEIENKGITFTCSNCNSDNLSSDEIVKCCECGKELCKYCAICSENEYYCDDCW